MTPRRTHRELTDFLVLALAVVSLVRTFIAEPFGVPTGSMAPTLLGAHKLICCPECGKTFPVGADDPKSPPVVCRCPACGATLDITAASVKAGNRIIVLKGPPTPLRRWDVAVFKFPDEPQKLYVKRIVGLPGERLRIRAGEIELWDEQSKTWKIARKPADLAKEMAIPVWEEEYQKTGAPEAWRAVPANSWVKEDGGWVSKGYGELRFSRRAFSGKSLLIGDDLGYNQGLPSALAANAEAYWDKPSNPVGDLHVAFDLDTPGASSPATEIHLITNAANLSLRVDLSKWEIYSGETLIGAPDDYSGAGMNGIYHVHFALIDHRLLLWRDGEFAGAWDAESDLNRAPTVADLEPIRIAVRSRRVSVRNLHVLRDVYYTQELAETDFLPTDAGRDLMGDVNQFQRFRNARQRAREFAVPNGCYLALGDNSPRSLDSRAWKQGPFIPARLIVGRVLTGLRP